MHPGIEDIERARGGYAVERRVVGRETWDCVTFPTGARLIYTEVPGDESAQAHHKYWKAHPDWKRGKQIAGVSSMVSTFDLKGENLNRWIGREAAASGDADPGKAKRDLGTRVHAVFEALAVGEPPPDEVPETDQGYVDSLVKWWEARQPEVIACEQFVYHDGLGYAGRYDLRARVDGRTQLIDLKTANNLYPKYGAQLVAYDLAAEWCGLGAADDLLILKVSGDGEFPQEVPAFITRMELLAAIETRKVAGRVRTQQQTHLRAQEAA